MILKRFSIVIFLVSVIAVGSLAPAFASSQLEVTIDPNSDTAVAKMTYQRSIVIDYSEGGKVAEVMNGKSDKLEFTASSSTTGMNSLIAKLNSYVASKGSQARITDLDLDYLVSFTGRTGNASLDYKIVLTPVIQDFVIKAGDGNSPTLIDIDWRGFGALGPVVISTLMHGDVEINLPISAIEGFFPALGLSMKSSEASELLTERLMNGDGIKDQPVGNWHFLFDPTGIGVDAAQHGFSTGSVHNKIYRIFC